MVNDRAVVGAWAKHAVITAVVLSASACASFGVGLTRPAFTTPRFPQFARDPDSQPTISSGRAGLPIMALDPGIYADEEGYHLFYTTVFCRREYRYAYSWDPTNPAECDIANTVGSVAYAFSRDRGMTWEYRSTPVVMPGPSGFDSAKIETPHVFRLGDLLYLTYSADGDRAGRPLTSRYQIGIARLDLGGRSVREVLMDESKQFARRATPLLAFDLRAGRFDNNVQEPSIVVGPDGLILYYVGLGLLLPDEPVDAPGQEITSVGLGRAMLDLDLNVITRSSSALLDGANITEVKYFDGAYHLFATTLSAGEFHRGERLSYSTSVDGMHWFAPAPIFERTVPGLDDWGAMAPTAVVERDRVVLFYTAYAAEQHPCFPVAANGRFGRPVVDGRECLYTTIGRAVSVRLTQK